MLRGSARPAWLVRYDWVLWAASAAGAALLVRDLVAISRRAPGADVHMLPLLAVAALWCARLFCWQGLVILFGPVVLLVVCYRFDASGDVIALAYLAAILVWVSGLIWAYGRGRDFKQELPPLLEQLFARSEPDEIDEVFR